VLRYRDGGSRLLGKKNDIILSRLKLVISYSPGYFYGYNKYSKLIGKIKLKL